MKKQIIAIVLGTTSLLFSNSASAYHTVNDNPGATNSQSQSQFKGANCSPARLIFIKSFNDVNALIEQGGSMWTNRATTTAAYEVPAGSGLRVIYAGALWMGGTDVNGQLKLAALTFRSANDFWPGPLLIRCLQQLDRQVKSLLEILVKWKICKYPLKKDFLKAEVIAFLDTEYPTLKYGKTCRL